MPNLISRLAAVSRITWTESTESGARNARAEQGSARVAESPINRGEQPAATASESGVWLWDRQA